MTMYAFTYHRPATLKEAAELFSGAEEAAFVSGGHTLLPTMKSRLAGPSDLVDLGGIAELRGISVEGDRIRIGAATRHADVAGSEELLRTIPALAGLAGSIGDPQVRNRGTMGGSVANNDPAADYPAAVLALDAIVVTDRREVPADDFFQGLFTTALDEGEILTAIAFRIPKSAAYAKMRNPASRYALAASFVAQYDDGVRVAVTGAGEDGVFRWPEAETALADDFTAEALSRLALPAEGMIGDLHASPSFRAHLAAVCTRRAVSNPERLTLC